MYQYATNKPLTYSAQLIFTDWSNLCSTAVLGQMRSLINKDRICMRFGLISKFWGRFFIMSFQSEQRWNFPGFHFFGSQQWEITRNSNYYFRNKFRPFCTSFRGALAVGSDLKWWRVVAVLGVSSQRWSRSGSGAIDTFCFYFLKITRWIFKKFQ